MNVLDQIKDRARTTGKTIVLPEGGDERTLRAAAAVREQGLAQVIVLGRPEQVEQLAYQQGVDLSSIPIQDPETAPGRDEYSEILLQERQHKGMSREEAWDLSAHPLYQAALMVKKGDGDGYVAGAAHTTADTYRPALQVIKTAPGFSVVSSCFLMIVPDCPYGDEGVLFFADCALNPDPEPRELAEIGLAAADTARALTGVEPRVAFLSFSTKGSGQHPLADRVVQAVKIARSQAPQVLMDGELQADTALVPAVGVKKAPDSKIAGNANILVFPDLQSGNIAYKLVERLAGALAVGPITQGLAAPVNDLSRGCSAEDIVNVVAITALQAQPSD